MTSISVSVDVSAPLERTFEVYTDLPRVAERIPGVVTLEVLSDGPFGVGTRWRETRIMLKKEATEEMWVTACDAPHSYTVASESHGMKYSTLFSFVVDQNGTKVTWDFTGSPQTLGTKVLSPLFNLLMKGAMIKLMRRDLEALRDVCESKETVAG